MIFKKYSVVVMRFFNKVKSVDNMISSSEVSPYTS